MGTKHKVEIGFTRPQLELLFNKARELDVRKGGIFDARSAAINFYSLPWADERAQAESELVGTAYFHWNTCQLHMIEVEAEFEGRDVLARLMQLEEAAFGRILHSEEVMTCLQ